MFTTLLVLFVAVVVVYILPQFLPTPSLKQREQAPPPMATIRLYSGPNDGEVLRVPGGKEELPHYFVQPYVPRDENGMPIPDEENIVHSANGMLYVKPSLAYYQQITDEDYIYVRDINESELAKIQMGLLPVVKKDE